MWLLHLFGAGNHASILSLANGMDSSPQQVNDPAKFWNDEGLLQSIGAQFTPMSMKL